MRGLRRGGMDVYEPLFAFRRGGVDSDFHSVPTYQFLFDIFSLVRSFGFGFV